MQLLSWNINGLRAVLTKGFLDFLEENKPDVLCLQEIKAHPEQVLGVSWPSDYQLFWNPAEKKGYSGTLTLTRLKPYSVTRGLGQKEHDTEGRVLTTEFDDFFLVNVYTPNSQRELARLSYRTETWDPLFRHYLKNLEQKKPVIACGDFNVAHQEIDLARPKDNLRNAGFTLEERTTFSELLDSGFRDTFRELEPGADHYTWWSFRSNARNRNIGWRIDYFLISSSLRPQLQKAFILPDILGSDHCPVGIQLGS